MGITFYDKEEAFQYKRDKALNEGKKVEITKSGDRYIAEERGYTKYNEPLSFPNKESYIESLNKVDKEDPTDYESEYYTTTVNDINKLIKERTYYGTRTITTNSPGYIIGWSNGSARWYGGGHKAKKGETITLDANEVFVSGIKREDLIRFMESERLEELPLYGGSFERREQKTPEYKGELPPMIKVVRDLDLPREKEVDDALLKKHEQN